MATVYSQVNVDKVVDWCLNIVAYNFRPYNTIHHWHYQFEQWYFFLCDQVSSSGWLLIELENSQRH